MARTVCTLVLSIAAYVVLTTSAARADDTGFAQAHDLRNEGGRSCFTDHWHSGFGTGTSKPAAQLAAIKSWAEFTDFEYGSDWARWSKSAGKRTSYTKEASGWGAAVESRPCK